MGSVFKEKRTSTDKKTGKIKVRYVWGYSIFDGTGQRKKKMIGTQYAAKEALKKAERDMFERVHLGKVPEEKHEEEPPVLFDDHAKEYLLYAQAEIVVKSCQRAESIIRLHLLPYFGGKPLEALRKPDGEKYKQKRLAAGAKPGTVKREMNVVQAICNRAVMLETSKANPLKGVPNITEPKGRVRWLKTDEKKRLLPELTTPPYLWSIVLVALPTGMRRGNIVDIRWDWIDFEKRVLVIPRTKNDEPQVVLLNQSAMTVLQALPRTDERVFPGVTRDAVSMAFRRACKRAGVTDFHFHDLRHTFASWLRSLGYDIRTIQKLLGHKDIRMSLRYENLPTESDRGAVDGLDTILGM